jgi:hypothetical protein
MPTIKTDRINREMQHIRKTLNRMISVMQPYADNGNDYAQGEVNGIKHALIVFGIIDDVVALAEAEAEATSETPVTGEP